MSAPIHIMQECKRGSNFVGNVIIASEDNSVKMINLNIFTKQIMKVNLDFMFPDRIEGAVSLSGNLIALSLANGFVNIFDLGLDDENKSKPYLL